MDERAAQNRRRALSWWTLAAALSEDGPPPELAKLAQQIATDLDVPPLLLDRRPSVSDLLRRDPGLRHDYARLERVLNPLPAESAGASAGEGAGPAAEPRAEAGADGAQAPPAGSAGSAARAELRGMLLFGKMLQNLFTPGMGAAQVSATQYTEWLQDVGRFEWVMGYPSGGLRGGAGAGGADSDVSGVAPEVFDEDLRFALHEARAGRGLMSEPEVKNALSHLEKSLINRMALREVLKDRALAEKLTPSMDLVEQLLRDKDNLSGEALANGKALIARFVNDLADVLKRQVKSASKARIDPRVPPKRVFRNLDLKRTLHKNLINWDPVRRRLLVNRLYYRRGAARVSNTRLIVVVDQSGSMVSAMVNCTILASIFAGLPKVDGHLVVFDTQVLDLSPWIDDPLEVLLRTKLGGGNDGPKAMLVAQAKIVDPKDTVMVWISDFYEFNNDQPLFAMIKNVVAAGVTFIPVGSVSSGGYFNVNPYFRQQFKAHGIPLMSGSLKTLIRELRAALP
jgi:hypothetical protein